MILNVIISLCIEYEKKYEKCSNVLQPDNFFFSFFFNTSIWIFKVTTTRSSRDSLDSNEVTNS